jgi:hypothetical protein
MSWLYHTMWFLEVGSKSCFLKLRRGCHFVTAYSAKPASLSHNVANSTQTFAHIITGNGPWCIRRHIVCNEGTIFLCWCFDYVKMWYCPIFRYDRISLDIECCLIIRQDVAGSSSNEADDGLWLWWWWVMIVHFHWQQLTTGLEVVHPLLCRLWAGCRYR